MFVYVIVCSETLKIYVGQHKGNNLQKYLQTKFSNAKRNSGTRSHLFAAMQKYSSERWSIHPLISDLQTREECDYWERLLIKTLNTQNPEVGYNICEGGEGNSGPGYWLGKHRSPETNAKIGAANSQHIMPEQTRQALRNCNLGNQYNRGRVQTAEEKLKRSIGMQGKQNTLGHTLTLEHRRKISEGLLRRKK